MRPLLTIYSHHFTISNMTIAAKHAVWDYLGTLVSYSTRKNRFGQIERKKDKVYAAANHNRSCVRIHINLYDEFIRFMFKKNFKESYFDRKVIEEPKAATAEFEMNPIFTARDYQIPQIEYVKAEGNAKILTLQTGKGKTYCALQSIADIGLRTIIVIPAKYLPKMIINVNESFGDDVDLCYIRNGKELRMACMLAADGEFNHDITIISSTLMYNYFKEYATVHPDEFSYDVVPEEFYEKCGIGVRLIDEVHENFHFNFKCDLYTNIYKTLNLSATVESDNPTTQKMIDAMFPVDMRSPALEYDRYCAITALMYAWENTDKIRYSRGGMYSHNVYEDWIRSSKKRLKTYLDLIVELTVDYYYTKKVDNQKCLIFAASVEMCKLMKAALSDKFPELKVSTKVQDDEFDVLDDSDIIVSTLLSTGTAVDIADLLVCIMTTALSNQQANLQAVGRLRKLKKYPDTTPRFYYLNCTQVPKHHDYHVKKQEIFKHKALTYEQLDLSMCL